MQINAIIKMVRIVIIIAPLMLNYIKAFIAGISKLGSYKG
jgi:hypothetical protein